MGVVSGVPLQPGPLAGTGQVTIVMSDVTLTSLNNFRSNFHHIHTYSVSTKKCLWCVVLWFLGKRYIHTSVAVALYIDSFK